MNNQNKIETCQCGSFVFDSEAKKCVTCGAERENKQDNPKVEERVIFQDLLSSKYVTLFMPHFSQNVRLKIECRSVFDSETPCVRLHGRCGKNVIVSETIFSQKDLNEMSHIFQLAKL